MEETHLNQRLESPPQLNSSSNRASSSFSLCFAVDENDRGSAREVGANKDKGRI